MASSALTPELAAQLALLRIYRTGTELGAFLSSALFGIFCVQVYTYATTPATKNEPRWIHCFVAMVVGLEITHTILMWIYVVDVGNRSLVNPFYYALDTPVFVGVLCMTGLIGAIVQTYYAYRIYRFAGHIWFSLPSWAGSLVRAGLTVYGCVAVTMRIHENGDFNIYDFKDSYGWIMIGTLSASVATDVLNTFFLCAMLISHRKGMGTFLIDRLIIWTVETELLTSCIAVCLLVVIVLGRYELLPGLYHVYPNLFSLSLIFTLNSREGLRRALHSRFAVSTSNSGPVSPRTRTILSQKDPYTNDITSHASNTFRLGELSRDHRYSSKEADTAV